MQTEVVVMGERDTRETGDDAKSIGSVVFNGDQGRLFVWSRGIGRLH